MMKNTATVAVLTYNAETYLEKLLGSVISQSTKKELDILVIDSGSSDGTLGIIKKYPNVRLHQIPNSDFGHGRTRNLAARMAKGEYILYLTQDAVPANEHWLEGMLEPFSISDNIACVVGKQVPLPETPVTIKREVTSVFRSLGPDDGITLSRQTGLTEKLGITNTFMSNTNSAVKVDILKKIPFRDVNYAEDQGLGIDILNHGYYKAYSSLGAVIHSHNYSVREYFRRKFDEYVGLRETTGYKGVAGPKELIVGSLKATILDWVFIARDKQYSFLQKVVNFGKSPFYNVGLRLAIRAAANKRISEKKRDKFSLEARSKGR